MGTDPPNRQGQRPVAAFDFDGTLITRDSFAAFLTWRAGPVRGPIGFVRLMPALLLYLVRRDRGRLKGAAAKVFLAGLSPSQLAEEAEAFAEARAGKLFRPDALQAWRAWKDKGALMVIVSATPEAIVAPFARRLRADKLIASRLALDGAGRIAGPLDGANCRGEEKVRRLKAEFGPEVRLAAAYGDTAGDKEMLALAETRGYRVFRAKP